MNIRELLANQKKLDIYIAKEKNLGDPYDEKFYVSRKLALLVEIGELANATRCFKYWSNKGPESKERILDETADVIHFCSSLINFEPSLWNPGELEDSIEFFKDEYIFENKLKPKVLEEIFDEAFGEAMYEDWLKVIKAACQINFILGHSVEEIEEAYLKKHKENYKRQQEGY